MAKNFQLVVQLAGDYFDTFDEMVAFEDRLTSRPFEYSYAKGIDPFAPASKRKIPKRSPRGTRAR